MSTLITGSIDLSKIPEGKKRRAENGSVYYDFTMSVNEETKYGNNCGVYDSQSKEEREAKAKRNYIGNGRVIWTDGTVTLAEKEEKPPVTAEGDDDLPF